MFTNGKVSERFAYSLSDSDNVYQAELIAFSQELSGTYHMLKISNYIDSRAALMALASGDKRDPTVTMVQEKLEGRVSLDEGPRWNS